MLETFRDLNQKIEERAQFLYAVYVVPHEWLHYLAARALGWRARRKAYSTRFYPPRRDDWRVGLVLVAPALVGIMFASLSIAWAMTEHRLWAGLFASGILLFAAGWEIACVSDAYALIRFWRYGKYPACVFGPSPTRLTNWADFKRALEREGRESGGELPPPDE